MRILTTTVLFLTFFYNSTNAQSDTTQSKEALALMANANTMSAHFKAGEYKQFVKYVHPAVINLVGGDAKMIEVLQKVDDNLKAQSITLNSVVYDQPSEIIKVDNSLQATIAQQSELLNSKAKVITYTTFVAISTDQGKSWKFIDTNHKTLEDLQKILPGISNKLIIPETRKPTVTRF